MGRDCKVRASSKTDAPMKITLRVGLNRPRGSSAGERWSQGIPETVSIYSSDTGYTPAHHDRAARHLSKDQESKDSSARSCATQEKLPASTDVSTHSKLKVSSYVPGKDASKEFGGFWRSLRGLKRKIVDEKSERDELQGK